jgi:hypothetical protein
MAQLCPCGCGKRLGWGVTKKGAATAYEQVSQWDELTRQIVLDELLHGLHPQGERVEMQRLLDTLSQIKGVLRDHLHGKARPATHPNLMQIAEGLPLIEDACMSWISTAYERGAIVEVEGQVIYRRPRG